MQIRTYFLVGALASLFLPAGVFFGQSKSKEKVFSTDAFRLAVPNDWTDVSTSASGDPWIYRSRRKDEGLTVSIVGWTEPMAREQRRSAFDKLVELRHRAETKMPNGPKGVKVTAPILAGADGIFVARYGGSDDTGRQFRCLLLGGNRAVTIFYYESVGMTESEADTRARPIFNSIHINK